MTVRALFISILMAGVAFASALVSEKAHTPVTAPDLEGMLPDVFDGWKSIAATVAILPPESDPGPGEATAYRAYKNDVGRVVTLVVAYGPPLGDSVRLHRPESCYVAQGFVIENRHKDMLTFASHNTPIIRMDTQKALQNEAVSYWLRDGDAYISDAAGHQMLFFKRGGGVSDGALVRVSSKGAGGDEFALHNSFMAAFVDALSPEARALLLAEM